MLVRGTRIWWRFSTFNVSSRRAADCADWADDETGETLPSRAERSRRGKRRALLGGSFRDDEGLSVPVLQAGLARQLGSFNDPF